MNGVILLAFMLSLPANELLIPIMLMAISGSSLMGVSAMSHGLLVQGGITWQMALSTMVFTLFHWPCATTLMTIRRETGSSAKTAAGFLLPTAVGILCCLTLRLVLHLLGS